MLDLYQALSKICLAFVRNEYLEITAFGKRIRYVCCGKNTMYRANCNKRSRA
ncbi:hypothetical protein [uncultured Bradyrhizobium sp.]|uniref:hypothetical protein n=1 Tax=uncultured Bradyrhizobium sp. TaxID=199684 RepID=UPI0026081BE1|nr:hypothetical protein [uncultured Bradyrhizobium sp.]